MLDPEIEFVEVDLLKGEQMQQWYLDINPLHTVPALVYNGEVINDSANILKYLSEKYEKLGGWYTWYTKQERTEEVHKAMKFGEELFELLLKHIIPNFFKKP